VAPGALIGAIRRFIDEALLAEGVLRTFMVDNGMTPVDRTLAHSWHGLVAQRGALPDGGRFYFHGIGCRIQVRDRPAVDVDWRGDVMIIDAWKIRTWLTDSGSPESDIKAIVSALEEMAATGEVAASGWSSTFDVVRS